MDMLVLLENWKNMEHECVGDINCNWYTLNDPFIYISPTVYNGLALYTVGDSEIDHLWGGRSEEGSMMLKDPKLPNDPED